MDNNDKKIGTQILESAGFEVREHQNNSFTLFFEGIKHSFYSSNNLHNIAFAIKIIKNDSFRKGHKQGIKQQQADIRKALGIKQ